MKRFYAAGIMAILGLAAVAYAADDFWIKKDWKEWTAAECERMLQDSPWAKTALVENENSGKGFSSIGRCATTSPVTTSLYGVGEIQYFVQLLSAETIRHAYLRQEQLKQRYSEMDEAQKKAFDEKMDEKIEASDPDVLAFHLVLTSKDDKLILVAAKAWQSAIAGGIPKDLVLITDKGVHVNPNNFELTPGTNREFDFTFPRLLAGQPVIGPGAKSFKVQIAYPAIGDFDKGKKTVEFKLDKMVKDGKPDF
ncbi:MAG TPA: hypothetical protein VKR82_01045 [Candidatus Acidoferrales bacterium]|nr:hypothetical protein [Candidatus Acidoferrales bacterium]